MALNKTDKNSLIDLVVNQDLCIGCGICAVVEPNIQMGWNEYGFLVAKAKERELSPKTLEVCPFNPYPEESVRTENELAELFLSEAPLKHNKIGRYFGTYVGYSNQFRLSSSSGGMATYILTELLSKRIIDHVVSVKPSVGTDSHYEYAVSSTEEEIINSSKTKYYPVTFTNALQKAKESDGKVAVVGVGCFVKAIRLLQHQDNYWKDKIPFILGIICGGVKSRFFAEYLASKAGVTHNEYADPQFRVKDYHSTASDYSYACTDKSGKERSIKMRSVGDMWGTGMFKANACDFCDDVTTELADISLGDAWLSPYVKDGKGTNVIVTRSEIADDLILKGIEKGDIQVGKLLLEKFLSSQQGSFNHRHAALKHRIRIAKRQDLAIPPKRHDQENISFDFKFVQKQRLQIRRKSMEFWKLTCNSNNFDRLMKKPLKRLRVITRINHYIRALKKSIFVKVMR